jgi:hypothetical protein
MRTAPARLPPLGRRPRFASAVLSRPTSRVKDGLCATAVGPYPQRSLSASVMRDLSAILSCSYVHGFPESLVLHLWSLGTVNLPRWSRVRGMSEVGGPGGKAQEFTAQVRQKVQKISTQAMAKAPELTGPVVQKAQRVVQEKPGAAAAGTALAVLGLLVLRRRPRRRVQARRRSRINRLWRWVRALAVLGVLLRRRRRGKES